MPRRIKDIMIVPIAFGASLLPWLIPIKTEDRICKCLNVLFTLGENPLPMKSTNLVRIKLKDKPIRGEVNKTMRIRIRLCQ